MQIEPEGAPIWEVSLAIQLSASFDWTAANFLAFHDRIKESFPTIETVAGHADLGAGVPPPRPNHAPIRWWFSSTNGEDLLQVQENYLALHWRKRTHPREASTYPGFDVILARFLPLVEELMAYGREMGDIPEISTVALYYDNVWTLVYSPGEVFTLSSLFSFWRSPETPAPMFEPQIQWAELIQRGGDAVPGVLNVLALAAGVHLPGGQEPGARLQLTARLDVSTDGQIEAALIAAHDAVHRTVARVVPQEVRSKWAAQP